MKRRSEITTLEVVKIPVLLFYFFVMSFCSITHAGVAGDIVYRNGFESPQFPYSTSLIQGSVTDGVDADATRVYLGVLVNTGEFRLDRTDLVVPGRGQLDFNFARRYRSQLDYDGPLGHGWDFSYNERLNILPDGSVLRSNGSGHIGHWISIGAGNYTAPRGYFGTLRQLGDGSFVLRESNGFRREFDKAGRLLAHRDRFGNHMLFSYDFDGNLVQIEDVYGRLYQLTYQLFGGQQRMVALVDFSGRQLVFAYDGQGQLTSVRSPIVAGTSTGNDFLAGRTERYAYYNNTGQVELNHNLVTVTYPVEVALAGPEAIHIVYGATGASHDRVTNLTLGGQNAASGVIAGGTAVFSWTDINGGVGLGDPAVGRLQLDLNERNANQRQYLVNERQHTITERFLTQGLRPGLEPATYWETINVYDEDGQLTETTLHEGNRVQYSYDQSGPRSAQKNLLSERQIADVDRGGGDDLVTSYSYEPVFNQLLTQTDPRGHAASYVPPIGIASSARYTTRHFYDFQENNLPIPDVLEFGIVTTALTRGLGDLNGDGESNQLAGNVVRIIEPPVTLRADSLLAMAAGSPAQVIMTELQWNDRGQGLAVIDPEGNRLSYSYYPENDPDGDGSPISGQLSTTARGYLDTSTTDAIPASPRRTSNEPPAALLTSYAYDSLGNRVVLLNPRGILTQWEYNTLNEVIVETRGADITEAQSSGQLITGESAFAYQTQYFYDHNGRVYREEAQDHASVSVTAGVDGWVQHLTVYDILDNPILSIQEIAGINTATTTQFYDANDMPTRLIMPEQNEVTIQYDERNLKFRESRGTGSPEQATFQWDYDGNANQIGSIDAQDNDNVAGFESIQTSYDGFDRPVMIIDQIGNQTQTSYDPNNNVVRVSHTGHPADLPLATHVLLADVVYLHDELGRRYEQQQALFLADGFNPLRPEDLRDTNSDGNVTSQWEYDALSRARFEIDDAGDAQQSEYDGAGRVVRRVDPLGNEQQFYYDANSNLVRQDSTDVSAGGLIADETFSTWLVYDQLDRLVRETDNIGRTQRIQYDSRDNLTQTSDASSASMGTDPLGLFTGNINGPGNTTRYFYDGRDLRVTEINDLRVSGSGDGLVDTSNPDNTDGLITLQYGYDLNSRAVSVTDDKGNTTATEYDSLDRKITVRYADSLEHTFTYDADSNQTGVVDPEGNQITNTFDALNRLVQRDIVRMPGTIGTTQELYSYDGLSRVTTTQDNNGASNHSTVRVYDSLSRLIEEQQDGEPYSSVWSGDGNRITLIYPTSRAIDYAYDINGRIDSITEPAAPMRGSVAAIADISWAGEGECCTCGCASRPLLISMGNDTMMTYLDNSGSVNVGYNSAREPVALRHLFNGNAFIDRKYSYNQIGLMLTEQYLEMNNTPIDNFVMDSSYRLIRADIPSDGALDGVSTLTEYRLDGVGNRTLVDFTQSFGRGVPFEFSESYVSNDLNEYISVAGNTRTHNDNGSLVEADGFYFIYDYRHRLVEYRRVSGNILRAAYEYDAFNRRVSKKLYDINNPGTLIEEFRYIYDEWQVIEEWGSDVDYSANGPLVTYVYGPGVDSPMQMQTSISHAAGAGTFYYHRDARNSIVALSNEMGAVVESTRYNEYGMPDQQNSIGNPYLFQGRRLDQETGLYYYRNRNYDPLRGRFIQRDPLWDPLNKGNQYTFVGNSPTGYRDPDGMISSTVNVRPKYTAIRGKKLTLESGVEVTLRGQARIPKVQAKNMNLTLNCRSTASGCKPGCKKVIADHATLELWVDIIYAEGNEATAKHEMQHAVQFQRAVVQALAGVPEFASKCKNSQALGWDLRRCNTTYRNSLAKTARTAAINASKQMGNAGKSRHKHKKSKNENEARDASEKPGWPAGIPVPLEFRPMRWIDGRGLVVEVDSRIRE